MQFMNGMMGGLGAAGLQGMVTGPIGIQINAETLLPGGGTAGLLPACLSSCMSNVHVRPSVPASQSSSIGHQRPSLSLFESGKCADQPAKPACYWLLS